MQHDVFISYHRNSSAQLVDSIVEALESHGIKCWYAPRDVESKYAGDIVRAIEECKVFLLVMNEQSTHSEHVLNEINYAFNRFHQKQAIHLLPFKTDKNDVSDDVKYYLGRIHFLDGSEPPEHDRIDALVARIAYWLQSDRWETETVRQEAAGNSLKGASDLPSLTSEIRSVSLVHNANFTGRREELAAMHGLLHGDNNKLFLSGPGGIGKSELARQYALQFKAEYQTILWLTYNTNIQDMIISDQFLFIRGLENENQDLTTPEAREAYYYKKLNFLKDHCGRETLIIVDNFDGEDERLTEFLEGNYSVILSTRLSREKDGYQELAVQPLGDTKDQLALFQKFYKRPLKAGEEEAVLQIFDAIGCHTYGIELLAKQMFASRMSPPAMLDFLHGKQTAAEKRSRLVMDHILDVMEHIFTFSGLTAEELSILKNMALLPVEGIETELFFDLTEAEDFMIIDRLIDQSFIQFNYITDVISLHPLIGNTLSRRYPGFADECESYVKNMTARLASFTHLKSAEKKKLLTLAEHYCLKWCDPALPHNIPFMERLAEAYAEYFMRDKSIGLMERLLTISRDPVKRSWYHYYISNQRRCLSQYSELSREAALSLSELEEAPESFEKNQQLSLAYSMNGWARYHENDMAASALYFEKSLNLRREILPDDDVLIAWGYYNSAGPLLKTGQIETCIRYYQEAIRRFLLIDEIGICVPAYIDLAEAYLQLNDIPAAEEALAQAFSYEYEYYGEENCRKYWLYQVKSHILAQKGQTEEAAEYERLSAEEYEKYLNHQ